MKKVQVLLSSYNGEKYLSEQLDSIFNQKGVIVHCLVRDDGSDDNTRLILSEYQQKYSNLEVVFDGNVGYKSSFFTLVQMSGDFDYYAFADQDDIWKEEKLSEAVRKISEIEEDLAVVYCSNCILVDNNLNYINLLNIKENMIPTSKIKALAQGFAHGCTTVFNSNTRNLIIKYKPKQQYAHDFWLPLLVLFLGRVIYDANSYILYRQHTNNIFGGRRSLLEVFNYRLKQLKINKNFHSILASEILEGYGDQLTAEDYGMLNDVSTYKSSLSKKIKLLFNKKLKRDTVKGTLYLKLLIISSRF
ncbi:glycosyltransferase [Paenibacillus odorifer]|uniref:glycosyltransferase n=1 Tax=Paenibacillus TaxID=44249 RepID=UPI00096DAA4E|nr:glycosyltransferase [Paenibacillus odorifer]OMC96975.1 hypothetical protein BJP46_27495 [Paenibacillus odorifer]